jgi:hypothetical protein
MILLFCITCSNTKNYNEYLLCSEKDHLIDIYLNKCKGHPLHRVKQYRRQKNSTIKSWFPSNAEKEHIEFNKVLEYNCDYCIECIKNIEKSRDDAILNMNTPIK